jgi:Zn-dependent metalloprotease
MNHTNSLLSFAIASAILALSAGSANASNEVESRALGLINANPKATSRSADDTFVARQTVLDADGAEHVRFDRTYRGLPVIGGDLVVHSDGGNFKGASRTLSAPINMSISPRLTSADAIVNAGAEFGSDFIGTPTAELVVFAHNVKTPRLAYAINYQGVDANDIGIDMTYIVDAKNGLVLDRWSNNQTTAATGTGKTIYSGNVALGTNSITGGFEMRDIARGGNYTTDFKNGATSKPGTGTIFTDADNIWGNNTNSDRASAGADAHFGVAMTWDFYQSLGRNGIANNGAGAYSRVHVGKNYVNAFWSDGCFCMSYGDGDGVTYGPLVDLDVAGHEMSHGVTSRSANLVYSGESGGLNEATSDIMGSMVEFFAGNALDTPDYLIGEEIYINNVPGSANQTALRYMYNPIKDTRSPNCYVSTLGSLDVHYSSGVANHFFYLLAEGSGAKTFSGVDHTSPTCNGSSVTGIGRDAATRIWYRALTVYMTSSTNYAAARVATVNAAGDLFGANSLQQNAVKAAWSAVSVN